MSMAHILFGFLIIVTAVSCFSILRKCKRFSLWFWMVLLLGLGLIWINPVFQELAFKTYFTAKASKMISALDQSSVIGKKYPDLIRILGEPESSKTHAPIVLDAQKNIVHTGDAYTVVRYRAVPRYIYMYGPDIAVTLDNNGNIKSYMVNY